MLLKLFFESLQFSVGECGVVIAKDMLQLALSLVSAPVVVVSINSLKLRNDRERIS